MDGVLALLQSTPRSMLLRFGIVTFFQRMQLTGGMKMFLQQALLQSVQHTLHTRIAADTSHQHYYRAMHTQ